MTGRLSLKDPYIAMNIAFIHTIFPGGGAERVTIDIADYLNSLDSDYNCYVYTRRIYEDLLTPEVEKKFKAVRHFEYKKGETQENIRKLLIQDKIDIVVQVVLRTRGVEKMCKELNIKNIYAHHSMPFYQYHDFLHSRQSTEFKRLIWKIFRRKIYVDWGYAQLRAVLATRKDYNRCDVFTCLCEGYKQDICRGIGIKPEKSHIVPICNMEHPVKDINFDKEKIIMYCGRLETSGKCVDRLLRIWGKIQDRLPDWQLYLVGDGPHKEQIINQIHNDRLERVTLTGYQPDVRQYYRKASIVCLTSKFEGWGLALTEAQANGCIPIAFNVSQGVEFILSPSGMNGFLVHPFDEDEYADTILKITSMTEEETMTIRQNAVRKSLEYTPETVGNKWKTLFDKLYQEKIK